MKTQSPSSENSLKSYDAIGVLVFQRHFTEVSTPIRVLSPAMEEHLVAFECEGKFLHTSPEFAMKRIVSSGLHRIFQIAHCFRKGDRYPSQLRIQNVGVVYCRVSMDQFLDDTLN